VVLLTLPSWFLGVLAVSIPAGIAVRSIRRSGRLRAWVVLVLLVLLFQWSTILHGMWAIAWYSAAATRPALEDLDLTLSRIQREEVVRRAVAGELERADDEYHTDSDYQLPDGFRGLSDRPSIWVHRDACGIRVFFRTITGFSPDPYGGFEYASAACEPEVDPYGSGQGHARPLGNGWYWVEAS
jgi:hypothetical protein